MPNNLQYYYKVLEQLGQWLPEERITRLRNMALMIIGLHLSRAIHLGLIVRKWPVAGKIPSLVNRLHRFLVNSQVVAQKWYEPVARQLLQACQGQPIRLVIDCTKIGFHSRLMTIGLAYKRRVLPLVWSVHRGSKGHTSVAAQLKLFKSIQPWLPKSSQVWVVGDSGFQSVHLLRWLRQQGWHFVIRQQGRNKVCQTNQSWTKISQLSLRPGQTRYIGWVYLTEKHAAGQFWLILHWQKGQDEPWYLVADCSGRHNLIRIYKRRMWIEQMYGDMKGHGFDLEATHLNDPERISRLVLAVCLTFVWFITLGSWVVKRGLRHLVDHKSRRDKSYFRIGWDWLERCLRLGQPIPFHLKLYL